MRRDRCFATYLTLTQTRLSKWLHTCGRSLDYWEGKDFPINNVKHLPAPGLSSWEVHTKATIDLQTARKLEFRFPWEPDSSKPLSFLSPRLSFSPDETDIVVFLAHTRVSAAAAAEKRSSLSSWEHIKEFSHEDQEDRRCALGTAPRVRWCWEAAFN